jgi:hypothetical protein
MRKRKLLWLLLIPVGVLSVPLLLFGMLIGSRLLSVLVGPVSIWNTTWHIPPVADTVGYYEFSEINWGGGGHEPLRSEDLKHSGFRLNADHTIEVIDVPAFGGFGEPLNCVYTGTGEWSEDERGGVMLDISIKVPTPGVSNKPLCAPASLSLIQVLGHSPPYRLWYGIGDPDNEMGLKYVRRRP